MCLELPFYLDPRFRRRAWVSPYPLRVDNRSALPFGASPAGTADGRRASAAPHSLAPRSVRGLPICRVRGISSYASFCHQPANHPPPGPHGIVVTPQGAPIAHSPKSVVGLDVASVT